jgi:PBP1b-binding outer membrane lipoprotein LpoB
MSSAVNMRNTKHIVIAFVLGAGFGALVAAGCTHAVLKRPAPHSSSLGEHTPPATLLDPNDYQLPIQKMATSMREKLLGTNDSTKPVISLGPIDNRTPYNISVEMIGNEIRAEVMKSGLAMFSTATDFAHEGGESGAISKQLQFQNESGNVDGATANKYG